MEENNTNQPSVTQTIIDEFIRSLEGSDIFTAEIIREITILAERGQLSSETQIENTINHNKA